MFLNDLSLEYLKEVDADDVPELLYDIVVNQINGNYEQELEIVQELPLVFRITYTVRTFMAEREVGGLEQYFQSIAVQYVFETIAAFKAIGLTDYANDIQLATEMVNIDEQSEEEFLNDLKLGLNDNIYDERVIMNLREVDDRINAHEEHVYDHLINYLTNQMDEHGENMLHEN